jgi:predicted nucleotidyltransferase
MTGAQMMSEQVLETSRSRATNAPGAGRRPISMREIRAVARRIARLFRPEKIILFGSYATGTPGPDSDVDLLVVMETPLSSRQQRLAISRALSPRPFPMDIVVRTPQEIQRRVTAGDFFLREIMATGKVLYEQTRDGMGGEG